MYMYMCSRKLKTTAILEYLNVGARKLLAGIARDVCMHLAGGVARM